MKRRQFIQALATVPAATALTQQPPAAPPAPGRGGRGGGRGGQAPAPVEPLDYGIADDAADPVARFFEPAQLAALTRLGDLFVPATPDAPGAVACGAAEFLDFLLGQSPADRQALYRNGVDVLNGQARLRFGKAFAETSAAEADAIVEPIGRPWSYEPSDPFEAFLRTAQRDLRQATTGSRARATATGTVAQVRWLRPL